jgi:hypothetical protein
MSVEENVKQETIENCYLLYAGFLLGFISTAKKKATCPSETADFQGTSLIYIAEDVARGVRTPNPKNYTESLSWYFYIPQVPWFDDR